MDLQKLTKHHRREAEYWRRLHANPALELHTQAVAFLEDVERRFGERSQRATVESAIASAIVAIGQIPPRAWPAA